MCESMPGTPPPFLFFVGARGEPGNEASLAVCTVWALSGASNVSCDLLISNYVVNVMV